jgi:hypothetical protein
VDFNHCAQDQEGGEREGMMIDVGKREERLKETIE